MARLILPRPNKLIYPGTAPGFDPSHPASQNIAISAVSVSPGLSSPAYTANTFLFNSVAGAPLTTTGTTGSYTASTIIDPLIGPATWETSVSSRYTTVAGNGQIPASITVAGIFTIKSTSSGAYQTIITIVKGQQGLWLLNTAGTINPDLFLAADNLASFSLTVGRSYFLAASFLNSVSPTTINFVARDLKTGQIFTAVNSATTGPASELDIRLGEDGADPSFCAIAAVMYSRTLLSLPQLLQWAQDPWSFWYPQRDIITLRTPTVAAAGAPFTQTDWPKVQPVRVGAARSDQAIVQQITPFIPTVWPEVSPIRTVPQFVVPYNGNLFGGVAPPKPFAKYDWGSSRTEVTLPFPPRGAYNTSLYSAVVPKPFVPFAWTAGAFQQASPSWRVPRNMNLFVVGPVVVPFSQTYWPPTYSVKSTTSRSDQSIMEFIVPFSKTDWPKPYVRQYITVAKSSGGLVDLSVPFVPLLFPPAATIRSVRGAAATLPWNANLYGVAVATTVTMPFNAWAVSYQIRVDTGPTYVMMARNMPLTTPVAGASHLKVWNGSSWVLKPTKVWSGAAWATKPVKVWNGTTWV